ncbi:MAG: tRNA (adenosine(37)-N6)-threonylcarbamoyltransferase complex dimerization subunit type 1 TsaB [Candidatus Omnitrophota bacterium]
MRILGIDTSSLVLSVAVSEDGGIIREESYSLDRKHSSLLIPKIKELLRKTRSGIDKIDGFVVGLGPGSFTGMRIGVSAVKGFGVATGKPCVGVASIDAMAMNAEADGVIVPIIDAKRQQVYAAVYDKKRDKIVRRSEYLLLPVEEVLKKIKGPVIFLGDGAGLYRGQIERLNEKAVFLDERYWYPRASNLIKLGLTKIKKAKAPGLDKLAPIYLYPDDCQIKRGR